MLVDTESLVEHAELVWSKPASRLQRHQICKKARTRWEKCVMCHSCLFPYWFYSQRHDASKSYLLSTKCVFSPDKSRLASRLLRPVMLFMRWRFKSVLCVNGRRERDRRSAEDGGEMPRRQMSGPRGWKNTLGERERIRKGSFWQTKEALIMLSAHYVISACTHRQQTDSLGRRWILWRQVLETKVKPPQRRGSLFCAPGRDPRLFYSLEQWGRNK